MYFFSHGEIQFTIFDYANFVNRFSWGKNNIFLWNKKRNMNKFFCEISC